MKKLYLVSGPLGVGKTTVSAALAKSLPNTALVVGDNLYNLGKESELEWEEKLQKAWDRILPAIKTHIENGRDVVLDFVVEDELPQIRAYFSKDDVQIRYVVLLADKVTLHERLATRNELNYETRSLILLKQLGKDPLNKNHLIDTSEMSVPEILQKITISPRFIAS